MSDTPPQYQPIMVNKTGDNFEFLDPPEGVIDSIPELLVSISQYIQRLETRIQRLERYIEVTSFHD